MVDLLVGFGLVLVFEGLVWAANPNFGRRMLEMASNTSEASLRRAGLICMAVGVAIVWLVRG